MNAMKVNKRTARKVLSVVRKGLSRGIGNQKPGEMCVEAAVCYAMGLPHGDNPPCVGEAVRAFKIRLNDSGWLSNESRAKGMEKLAIAQLGSNSIDQKAFSEYVALETSRKIIPAMIRKQVRSEEYTPSYSMGLLALARKISACEKKKPEWMSLQVVLSEFPMETCSWQAMIAACGALMPGNAVTSASVSARCADYAREVLGERALRMSAAIGLEALKKLNSPGCKWLDLVEE